MSGNARLAELVAEILRVPTASVTDTLALANSENWDSLTHMELVAAVEQEFGIALSADDIVAMVSFAGIRSVLGEKGLAV